MAEIPLSRYLTGIAMSLIAIAISLYLLVPAIIDENSIQLLSGHLSDANTYVSLVNRESAFSRHEHPYLKTELVFHLQEQDKTFTLSTLKETYENVSWVYNDIQRWLLKADTVTVWIPSSQLHVTKPQVMKIDCDGRPAYQKPT